jgi:hypothetical protein
MNERVGVYVIAFLPAITLALSTLLVGVLLNRIIDGSPIFAAAGNIADWVVLLGMLAAFGIAVDRAVRLARWTRGEGPDCQRCGGPLGTEKLGRYGVYKKCLCCRKNNRVEEAR